MTPPERPDGYDALPKRFKDYISRLEADVEGLVKSRPSQTPTNLKVVDHLSNEVTYLPDEARLQFTVGGMAVQVYEQDGSLKVYGERSLAVLPEVSNVVGIRSRD